MSRWLNQDTIRKKLELSLENFFQTTGERKAVIRSIIEDKLEGLQDTVAVDQFITLAIQRLKAGEPVQYITGKSHFMGNIFTVDPAVLIPRPETEEMTDLAVKLLKSRPGQSTILDLGTGSGCIAITIKKSIPDSQVIAWDISPQALIIAQKNATRHKTDIHFLQVDALSPASWESLSDLDMIITNPPYIANNERYAIDAHVLLHEPDIALFAPGDDPLIFYKVLAHEAGRSLKADGLILCECSAFTAEAVQTLFMDYGWLEVELRNDLSENPRFIIAKNYCQPPAGFVPV